MSEHQFVHQWPETEIPMLMMNGDFNVATPIEIAERAKNHFNKAHQTFVRIPFAFHGVLASSKTTDSPPTCGLNLMEQFIHDPTSPLDLSCTQKTIAPALDNQEIAESVFQSRSLWDLE